MQSETQSYAHESSSYGFNHVCCDWMKKFNISHESDQGFHQQQSDEDSSSPDVSQPSFNSPKQSESRNIIVSIMIIPNDLIGCVIGRGGAKISEIRNASKAQIKISNSDENCRQRKITICGDPGQVAMAKYYINNSIELHKHLLALNMALNPLCPPRPHFPVNHPRPQQPVVHEVPKTLATLLFNASPLFQRDDSPLRMTGHGHLPLFLESFNNALSDPANSIK